MVKPRDESARARFASELDRNFSVVASAGSGKTTAITKRVLSIARSPNAVKILPCLVIVTFTNRAADEMQQRTRQALLQENLRPDVQTAFNRAFFGTIHSFCMKLLTDFGHFLGLPAPLELVEDDDELWQEFAQNQTRIGRSLGEKDRGTLLRFVQAGNLMELARRAGSAVLPRPEPSPCPPLDFAEVYQSVDQAGRRQHWQIAGGIARVGKAFRRRLGISALAGLFHGPKRQVYSALARKICAPAKMDLRGCHLRRGGGAT